MISDHEFRLIVYALAGVPALLHAIVQVWKRVRTKKGLSGLGALRTLSLGECLAGFSGLEPSSAVTGGETATELIVMTTDNSRELGRISWNSIRAIFAGDELGIYKHLPAGEVLPALRLAKLPPLDKNVDVYTPSYLIIDWGDPSTDPKRAVFVFWAGRPLLRSWPSAWS